MSKTAKIITGIIILILLVWGISSSQKKQEVSGEVIKIGYFGPFTGPAAATSGEDIGNAWKLAVAKRPEVAGKRIEVIYEDDACDPKKAASAATKLITVDKVNILVSGVCSGSTIAAAPIAEANKVILFTPVSTSPKITTAGDYVFRTSGTGVHTAIALTKYLAELNYKKIAILFENAEYTVGIKDSFIPLFTGVSGNTIVATEGIAPNEADMRGQLTKINQAKPEAVVVIMNSAVTANGFVKQSKQLGLNFPIFGNEYFAFSVVVENPEANGIYATQYKYDQNAKAYTSYLADYEKVYGKKPSQDIYAALPFDGYNVLANVIEECEGDNPECIKTEFYKVRGYQGIAGIISIDANGDTEREFTLRKIQDGKLVDVK